jgi:hypothetical protein
MLHSATRELLGEPKVSKYDVAISSDKDVLRLEVTIDDARSMQTLDTLNNFGGIEIGTVETGTVAPKGTPSC